jgi:O-Antigen ligase
MIATHPPAPGAWTRARAELSLHGTALIPGLLVVGLMLVWAVHNGGYDADTWYWGALLLLSASAAVVAGLGVGRLRYSRASGWALVALALYVGWSYLSIAWAQSPGDALEGSNRALLYLLVFALMAALPWTAEAAIVALLTFAVGIGAIAVVVLLRFASADRVSQLVIDGRLSSPTGYFNSTVALFMIGALVSVGLASRRELPGLIRGVLIGLAAGDLQLVVVGQSRGWLFTLPLVAIASLAVVRDRLRVVAAAALPVIATLIPVHRLIAVFDSTAPAALDHAARSAGRTALLLCAAAVLAGTLIAWSETLLRPSAISARSRLILGSALAVLAIAGGSAGAVAATHGHPVAFIKRQWNGFSHPSTAADTGSHFGAVGSGRYDFWRVSLDALASHPIGGLGQDNFGDYYLPRRHTSEEPAWTHSLEMRLLAHTGIVGFALFGAFVAGALVAAVAARRRASLAGAAAGVALLPLVVWLIHGSVDWFWEVPALSGPALGFLGMATALREPAREQPPRYLRLPRIPRPLAAGAGALALLAGAVVLGFPYLSVREVSIASNLRARNPAAALNHLSDAGSLDPLSAEPGRLGGTIALQSSRFTEAQQRFGQAIAREPGGWYGWFGQGLAASALGDPQTARHDFRIASSINSQQPAIKQALARVDTGHPLTPSEAFGLLVLAH